MRSCFFRLSIFIAFLMGSISHVCAQDSDVNLLLTLTNGEEITYRLSKDSHLYFEDGLQLVIDNGSGNTITHPLSQIRKMVCSEILGNEEIVVSNLQILPNPGHNQVIIKNLSGNCQGRIYSLDGRMVKAFEANEGVMIDISDLSEGMYLLNINGQTLKLMKL